MLQSRDISKTEEIKIFFKNNWLELPVLHEQLKLIKFSKTERMFKTAKTKDVDIYTIINLLLFLPMLGLRSVNQAVNSTLEQTNKKDVYYRGLANQNINRRSLLLLISKRYLLLKPNTSGEKYLIFDDTEI